ncbi:spore coat U domain-containing protein [Vibrio gallicus]|uniref:spore coat U domain-containing protein n=1 Tax=Vibrio gallicus TaxID=190897 RepID=UPI0021C3D324|nr:spore coat U domain-containing protein [Vibrio gallicus]
MKQVFFAAILGLALFGLIIPDADAGKRHKHRMCNSYDTPPGDDQGDDPGGVMCDISDDIIITGIVPCECELTIDFDNTLGTNVFASELNHTDLGLGSVSAYCNTVDGFKVTMSSANGGMARNGGGAPSLPYTLNVGSYVFDPAVAFEETIDQVNATDFENAALELNVDASDALEGTYSDTVTIEVAGVI